MKSDVLTKVTINKAVTRDVTHVPGDLQPVANWQVIWWEWFCVAIQCAPASLETSVERRTLVWTRDAFKFLIYIFPLC